MYDVKLGSYVLAIRQILYEGFGEGQSQRLQQLPSGMVNHQEPGFAGVQFVSSINEALVLKETPPYWLATPVWILGNFFLMPNSI